VASAQSFTLWQQATIEITQQDHYIIACWCHICIGVILRPHPVHGESHIQRNVNRDIATTSPYYNESHRSPVLLWRFHLPWPSHPGRSTILLQSVRLSSKCAKLHTVAASNNRDHPIRSLYYCLFAPHIYRCYCLRTSCSLWITHSTQHQLRGCNNAFLRHKTW